MNLRQDVIPELFILVLLYLLLDRLEFLGFFLGRIGGVRPAKRFLLVHGGDTLDA